MKGNKRKQQQKLQQQQQQQQQQSTKAKQQQEQKAPIVERTEEEWRNLFPKYPRDPDDNRFMKAYDPSDEKGIMKGLAKYGVIVVDVLTPQQADRGLAGLVRELNTRSHAPIDVYDPNTWEDKNWPTTRFLTGDVAVCPEAFETRLNANVKRVWRTIYGTDQLFCSIDHFGLMRGTVNLKLKRQVSTDHQSGVETEAEAEEKETMKSKDEVQEEVEVVEDRPQWRQRALRVHWDVNPEMYVDELQRGLPKRYQGIVAMDDCPEAVGGFCCVPGSSAFLKQWLLEGHKPQGRKYLSESDPMHRYLQRFPLRKGQMVVWNYGQAHANYENHSHRCRLIQFVRYMPAMKYAVEQDNRSPTKILATHPQANAIKRMLKSTFSEEDQRLFALSRGRVQAL